MQLNQHVFKNYCGLTDHRFTLNSSDFNETTYLETQNKSNYTAGIASFNMYKSEIFYVYEDYKSAMTHIEEADKIAQSLLGTMYITRYSIVAFMVFAALYPKMGSKEKNRAWKRMKKEHGQMKKLSDHCSINTLHLQLMMEAEMARLTGFQEAAKLYDQATQTAHENDYLAEAWTNELAAKFYLDREQKTIASTCRRHIVVMKDGGQKEN